MSIIIKKEVENVVSHEGEAKVTESKHIISIVGLERSDFPFFLGKLLEQYHTQEGYRDVLLIDNSDTKPLFSIVDKIGNDTYSLNRMTFVQDVDYSEEYFDNYSFVIIFHGMDVDQALLDVSDLVILSTDYIPSTYASLKNVLSDVKPMHIVYRNWATKKIKESVVEDELGIPKENVESRSVIKSSLEDDMAYVLLQHNGNQRLKSAGLSDLLQESLRYFTEIITGADEKFVQQMFKKAI